jgi:hypothetical protein
MNEIKVYKKFTHILLKDGRVLTSEQTPQAIYSWLNEHSHIMINGEMHSKFSILSAVVVDLDELEGFILAQSAETQTKIRNKIRRLKDELGKEMTLEYAKNYVKEHR